MNQKQGCATRKIPAGKLVRVDVVFSDRIEAVKITGDFFLHPEETLDEIIHFLQGQSLPLDPAMLSRELANLLEQNDAQLIGASSQDLAEIVLEALQ